MTYYSSATGRLKWGEDHEGEKCCVTPQSTSRCLQIMRQPALLGLCADETQRSDKTISQHDFLELGSNQSKIKVQSAIHRPGFNFTFKTTYPHTKTLHPLSVDQIGISFQNINSYKLVQISWDYTTYTIVLPNDCGPICDAKFRTKY